MGGFCIARRIGVFSTGDLPLILASGVEELKGVHSAVPYETNYGLLTYHEEQFIIISVRVKIDNEKEERVFTVNFNAKANRQALLALLMAHQFGFQQQNLVSSKMI
ncbi:UNVERIFIED_CONTAM: hypothetical protein ABIC26_002816 [Paenibacillus sp. PvR008]